MTFEEWYRQHFGDAAAVQPKKLAEVLGVSRETIYRNLRSADLESFKIGPRSYVIPEPALKKWLAWLATSPRPRSKIRIPFDDF